MSDIEERLARIEDLFTNGFSEELTELNRVIMGDKNLGVDPLRTDFETISAEVQKVNKLINNGKWFLAGLGLTNIGAIGVGVANLLESLQ